MRTEYIKSIIDKYHKHFVLFLLTFLSVFSFYYFFINNQHLLYGDAVSRLNISRKIVDNLTPGLAQLGNVWLPLPQLLMLLFTWNSYLWHSGIAGSLVSMFSYIAGGVYLYKSARILSKSYSASFFALCVYALNINLLYLQTTAMSETIFICSTILSMYFFIEWIKSGNKMQYLMLAGISISAATLIRYEALALMISSIPLVFYYLWSRKKGYNKAEGHTIMYVFLACLGFAIWTLYLTVIFGDPLYWKNFYADTKVVNEGAVQIKTYAYNLNIFQAFWKYFTSVVWMSGLIPALLAVIAFPLMILDSRKNKTYYFIPICISMSMFGFMMLTLQRNTPINQPDLTLANIFSSETSHFNEFNIRYGLIMLPVVSLLSVYILRTRLIFIKGLICGLLFIQIFSYFKPTYSVIYQIPISISRSSYQGNLREKLMTDWLKKNYRGGLIMISALKHDPQMFQLGIDYKKYIHEGTGKYWRESSKKPQLYATWIVFDSKNAEDQVTKFINFPALKKNFNEVYNDEGLKIYKIKTKPEIQINN